MIPEAGHVMPGLGPSLARLGEGIAWQGLVTAGLGKDPNDHGTAGRGQAGRRRTWPGSARTRGLARQVSGKARCWLGSAQRGMDPIDQGSARQAGARRGVATLAQAGHAMARRWPGRARLGEDPNEHGRTRLGAVRPGSSWLGRAAARRGRSGQAMRGEARLGTARTQMNHGTARQGMACRGAARRGTARLCVAPRGSARTQMTWAWLGVSWLAMAGLGPARMGSARTQMIPGWTRQGQARLGTARTQGSAWQRFATARPGLVGRGKARTQTDGTRHGAARRHRARPGSARCGSTWFGPVRPGVAGQGEARYGLAGPGRGVARRREASARLGQVRLGPKRVRARQGTPWRALAGLGVAPARRVGAWLGEDPTTPGGARPGIGQAGLRPAGHGHHEVVR